VFLFLDASRDVERRVVFVASSARRRGCWVPAARRSAGGLRPPVERWNRIAVDDPANAEALGAAEHGPQRHLVHSYRSYGDLRFVRSRRQPHFRIVAIGAVSMRLLL
jgi:hypothetical protein